MKQTSPLISRSPVLLGVLAISLLMGSASAGEPGLKLVEAQWLKQRIHEENIVLLHVGSPASFKKEHISGAHRAPGKDLITMVPDGLSHELPDPDSLASILAAWDIEPGSRIIIYYTDEGGVSVAARIFMTLDYAGLGEQTALLNGGLEAWKAVSGSIDSGSEMLAPEAAAAGIKTSDILADHTWLTANHKDKEVLLIDGRPPDNYNGREKLGHFERKGHIPGARNIPFYSLMRTDDPLMFRSRDEMMTLFEEAGYRPGDTIVTYCGTGIWAAPVYFAARVLGLTVKFYDGSFEEWAADESLAVVAPVKKGLFRR